MRTAKECSSQVQTLTSKLEPGLLANDGAVDVTGHTDVRPSVFLLLGVVDHQIPPHKAVVFIGLLHQLDFPVITAPPVSGSKGKEMFRKPLIKFFLDHQHLQLICKLKILLLHMQLKHVSTCGSTLLRHHVGTRGDTYQTHPDAVSVTSNGSAVYCQTFGEILDEQRG